MTEHVVAVGCGDAEAEHDGQLGGDSVGGIDGDAGILNVEDGLDEQCIDTTVGESTDLLFVGFAQKVGAAWGTGTDTVTHLGSCFIAAPPGGMQFSAKGAFDLPTKTTCRFSVVAANADGVLSPASTVEARLTSGVGFGLFLK